MKWVKYALITLVVVAMSSMWLMLKASKAEQAALRARLDNALSANKVSQSSLDMLQSDNQELNQLLVERKLIQNQTEAKLDDDKKALQAKLASVECYQKPWPNDVTNRLREPY